MTNTDICNMALSYVKKRKVASLDEATEEARACKLHYEHLRMMVLRDYNWGFAKRSLKLSQLDVKSPAWSYVYAYPKRSIAARFVFSEGFARERERLREKFDVFLLEGNVLAIGTDVNKAFLEYTHDVTETELFSQDFVDALAHLLASNLAIPLAANQALQNLHYQLFQIAMNKAKASSANEMEREYVFPESYLKARG